jgi:hypothetical protein
MKNAAVLKKFQLIPFKLTGFLSLKGGHERQRGKGKI